MIAHCSNSRPLQIVASVNALLWLAVISTEETIQPMSNHFIDENKGSWRHKPLFWKWLPPTNLPAHLKRAIIVGDMYNEAGRYLCDLCSYAGSTKDNLRVHMESRHEGKTYVCEVCPLYAGTTKEYLSVTKLLIIAFLLLLLYLGWLWISGHSSG